MPKKKTSKSNQNNGQKRASYKVLWAFLFLIILFAVYSVYIAYKSIYLPIPALKTGPVAFYIKSGWGYTETKKSLMEKGIILNSAIFDWLSDQKNLKSKIKPGKYKLKPGININDLINILRSGDQEPVFITIGQFRTKEKLINYLEKNLELDADSISAFLSNDFYMEKYNLNSENSLCLFIPNTYQFLWNTNASAFLQRMKIENERFWNNERMRKLKEKNISKTQAYIIASIVEKETNYQPEKSYIASVYLNRLKKKMKLQADPTVVFAVGDFTINRVLKKHLEKDSPYNTYLYEGLPPGPICIPSQNSIDAVLKAPQTGFIYFCAKEDFSGKHNFATNLNDHQKNARKFQKELNKRKIMK